MKGKILPGLPLKVGLTMGGGIARAVASLLEAREILENLRVHPEDPEATRQGLRIALGLLRERLEEAQQALQPGPEA